jgi:hypoxanthine-DNA glycosylase
VPKPGRLIGLAPAVDARVHTLILGSFPSAASLAAGQYYAHPRNQFWPILAAVLGEPLPALPYAERLARLHVHGIGLWDVFGRCDRPGSLDAAIRNAVVNDLAPLHGRLPHLRRVLFNGKAAELAGRSLPAARCARAVLPSSSPAHAALRLDAKIALWRDALRPFVAEMPTSGRTKPLQNEKTNQCGGAGRALVGHNRTNPILPAQ